jgi:hypothetical protein
VSVQNEKKTNTYICDWKFYLSEAATWVKHCPRRKKRPTILQTFPNIKRSGAF